MRLPRNLPGAGIASALIFSLILPLATLMTGLLAGQEKPQAPAPPSGAPVPPSGPPPGGGSPFGGFGFFVPLLLCFAVFWFLVILPDKRKQKVRQEMIRNVKKGDQVVTTAGIVGRIVKDVKPDDREVVLQVDRDNDVRIRFLRSAIHEVVPEGGTAEGNLPPPGSAK